MIKIDDYNNGSGILPENRFKVSPSMLEKFWSKPWQWFANQVEKKEVFPGNTGSSIGNIVHKRAELYLRGEALDAESIHTYINGLRTDTENPNFMHRLDPSIVYNNHDQMYQVLKQKYLSQISAYKTEGYTWISLSKHVVLAGSYDLLRLDENGGLIVVDYKTILKKPRKMDYAHKLQAFAYAKSLKAEGLNITGIEIVYINRPEQLKTKYNPADVTVFQEEFTPQNEAFISSLLELVSDSMELFFEHPEYVDIIFKDNRLKNTNFTEIVKPYQQKIEDDF